MGLPISLATIEFDLAGGLPDDRRFWIVTGDAAAPGMWKHKNLWRFLLAVRFCCALAEAECREHWLLATTREYALACLVRDLKQDPRAPFIGRVVVYEIHPPLARRAVYDIEQINARLRRERDAARPPRQTQGSLAFDSRPAQPEAAPPPSLAAPPASSRDSRAGRSRPARAALLWE